MNYYVINNTHSDELHHTAILPSQIVNPDRCKAVELASGEFWHSKVVTKLQGEKKGN